MPKVYVVTEPPEIRGIYRTWPECEAKVKGVRGARFQSVANEEKAEAMLRGEGTALTPGLWAFVDGNHLGGVGVVLVRKTDEDQETVVEQGGYTVVEVLAGAGIPELASKKAINGSRIHLFGIAYAARQCEELLAGGAPGIHFYTVNRAGPTRAVLGALRAARSWDRAPTPA